MNDNIVIRRERVRGPFAKVYGPYVVDKRISDGAERTMNLLDILCGADEQGQHGVGLIAKLRHLSVRSIERHIIELKNAGLIRIEYRQGQTNILTILDPIGVYGEAIQTFYSFVGNVAKKRRATTTPDKNDGGTPDKNDRGTPDKNGVQSRGGRADEKGAPFGALSPSAPKQSGLPPTSGEGPVDGEFKTADCEDPAPESSQSYFTPQEPLNTANPPPAMNQAGRIASSEGDQNRKEGKTPQTVCEKPFTSSRSGCGITIPGEDEESKRKKKARGTSLPPEEWNSEAAAEYFKQKFKKAWPGEGAPHAGVASLSAIKGRINWLKAEGIGVDFMKKAIDHLFEGWSNGLPSRLKWQGSRPTLALIENIRLFERLVREVQSGTGAYGTVDEYKDKTPEDKAMIEKYTEKDRVRAELINGGMDMWAAEREAKRRVGI
jgi:hypothetical protein